MNNLKRVLSLALTGAMLVGTMLVGASAVNGKDFTDKDEITHNEAVDTLVTLNVINGKDDGSYDPTGSLTRAEMAKLIVYALNGGKEPVMSTKANPTYTDIKGHWAEKYIEYCSNLGIVAGRGDGTFDPAGVLTGSQAAKMMLVAMNYKSDVFGFVGADWELNVNGEANKAGLYKELLGMDPSAVITRDQAAQLVYNGILANTMELSWGQNMSTGAITQNYQLTGAPLFNQKFNGTSYEGVLVATGKYALDTNPVAAGETITGNGAGKFVIAQTKIGNVTLPTTGTGAIALGAVEDFKSTEDMSALMGKSVKVLYNTSSKTVYGVYAVTDNNAVVVDTTTDAVSDIKVDTIKIDGDVYDVDALQVFENGVKASNNATALSGGARTVTFIDNDGDEKIDVAIVNKVASYQVSYVGSTTFTLGTKIAGDTGVLTSNTQKLADVTYYDGMAKDDVVFVTKDLFNNTDKITKAELTTAPITGTRTVSGTAQYQIDGAWYEDATSSTLALGNSVEFAALGNQLYYVDVKTGAKGLDDIAMLLTYSTSNNVDAGQVKLLLSDGSTVTGTAGKVRNMADSADYTLTTTDCGKLFTYKVSSGKYDLYQIDASTDYSTGAKKVGDFVSLTASTLVDNATTPASADGSVVNRISDGTTHFQVADDAVIFVFKGTPAPATSNAGRIVTGKELKTLKIFATNTQTDNTKDGVVSAANAALYKSANGFDRIAVASVTTSNSHWPVGSSSANYGYLVSAPYQSEVDGTKSITYQVWDGTQTVTYKEITDNTVDAAAVKGAVIGYDVVDAGTIKSVNVITTATYGVVGKSGNDIKLSKPADATQMEIKVDSDTKYLYVNSKAGSAADIGVEGGEITNATNPGALDTGSKNKIYVANIRTDAAAGGTAKIVVVDTNNDMALFTSEKQALTLTAHTNLTVSINDTEYTATTANAVAPGDIIRLTNSGNAALNLAAGEVTGVIGTGDQNALVTLQAGETVTFIALGTAAVVVNHA